MGNTIDQAGDCIRIDLKSQAVSLIGNTCHNFSGTGINILNPSASDILVMGNTVFDSTGKGAGVYAVTDRIVIRGNAIGQIPGTGQPIVYRGKQGIIEGNLLPSGAGTEP